jgi:acylaminoacyl-peptidase
MATTQASEAAADKGLPLAVDATMVDEYVSQSKLLQEFVKIPTIGKAWIFNSKDGMHCCCYIFFFVHEI